MNTLEEQTRQVELTKLQIQLNNACIRKGMSKEQRDDIRYKNAELQEYVLEGKHVYENQFVERHDRQ